MWFKINKNRHRSHKTRNIPLPFGFVLGNTISRNITFDRSCLYQLDGEDKYDINKLFGFSTSWFHHIQSARVGWRCTDGKNIKLFTYCYDNNIRLVEKFITTIKTCESADISITIDKKTNSFIFRFSNNDKISVVEQRFDKNVSWFKYLLYPYFGGNKNAPNDMYIKIDKN